MRAGPSRPAFSLLSAALTPVLRSVLPRLSAGNARILGDSQAYERQSLTGFMDTCSEQE